ncbi:hypothetical protein [Asaia sp. HumB]|uniref:hypothetical protein n=1 Tax=Asaia sp. HumB TaxID=3035475 RepID=UPI002552D4BB|nr:hypothetical protein [Asaia sp. HumB]MDL2169594.1 hypothetical protein [Asaia sp. HumB]
MVDLSKTIIANSDQLNADDLAGGPMTLVITEVRGGSSDQPVLIFYQGSGKKSFRPCKSMRRVLAGVWGNDGKTYVGKSLVVFRDQTVTYGKEAVGGVRISHMSHIERDAQVSLIVKQGRRGLYTVKPLKIEVQTQADTKAHTIQEKYAYFLRKAEKPEQVISVRGKWNDYVAQADENGNPIPDDLQNEVAEMIQTRLDELAANYAGQSDPMPA